MDFNLQPGISAQVEMVVSQQDTAKEFGSGGVEVFATPKMIGLMENAAVSAVESLLPEGYGTVGTLLDIRHTAATPVGMRVYARAELMEVEGRKLIFKVEAFDEVEKIGEGTHHRFIIDKERFLSKAAGKLK